MIFPALRGNKIAVCTKNMALQAIFSWQPQVAGASVASCHAAFSKHKALRA